METLCDLAKSARRTEPTLTPWKNGEGAGQPVANEFPYLGTPMHSTTQAVDAISSAKTD
jgi:hypothetical protein